jgi:hypothetical protein
MVAGTAQQLRINRELLFLKLAPKVGRFFETPMPLAGENRAT